MQSVWRTHAGLLLDRGIAIATLALTLAVASTLTAVLSLFVTPLHRHAH